MRLLGNVPPSPKGTLTPCIPLSLTGPKGEGERRTEADVGAAHPRLPLVRYCGEGGRPPRPRFLAGHRNDREGRGGLEGCEGLEGRELPHARPFDFAQDERPSPRGRNTLTQAPDSSRGIGMTERGGVAWRDVKDWRGVGYPPLDPSTSLRMSGPAPGEGTPSPKPQIPRRASE